MMLFRKYSLQNKEVGLYGFFHIFTSGTNPEFNWGYMLSLLLCCYLAGFFHIINSFTSSSYNKVDNLFPLKKSRNGSPLKEFPT